MKKISIALVVLLSLSFGYYSSSDTLFSSNNFSFVKHFKMDAEAIDLSLSTTGGDINISTQQGNVTEVAFQVKSKSKILDITFWELKKYADVIISHTKNTIDINVKKIFDKHISIGFAVKTTAKCQTKLHTSGGNIDIKGIQRNIEAHTSGGDIHLENTKGSINIKTSGGNIKIVNQKGNSNIKTSGGDITIDDADGYVNMDTSGGNISGTKISKGLSAKTSGGNIILKGVREKIFAHTSGGNIDVVVDTVLSSIDLETSGGNIHATIPSGMGLDLNLKGNHVTTTLENFSGINKENKIIGTVNGGGIQTKIHSSGGNIDLDYQ